MDPCSIFSRTGLEAVLGGIGGATDAGFGGGGGAARTGIRGFAKGLGIVTSFSNEATGVASELDGGETGLEIGSK